MWYRAKPHCILFWLKDVIPLPYNLVLYSALLKRGVRGRHKEFNFFHSALEDSLCKYPEIAIPPSQCLWKALYAILILQKGKQAHRFIQHLRFLWWVTAQAQRCQWGLETKFISKGKTLRIMKQRCWKPVALVQSFVSDTMGTHTVNPSACSTDVSKPLPLVDHSGGGSCSFRPMALFRLRQGNEWKE